MFLGMIDKAPPAMSVNLHFSEVHFFRKPQLSVEIPILIYNQMPSE
jgi:hypothetical protein